VPLLMNRFTDYADTYDQACNDATACSPPSKTSATAPTTPPSAACWRATGACRRTSPGPSCCTTTTACWTTRPPTTPSARWWRCRCWPKKASSACTAAHHVYEWDKGGDAACRHLGLTEDETEDLLDELNETFHTER
jgi:hypothetical protein